LTRDMRCLITYLLNVCLLEKGRNSSDGYVRMHDMIRDVALHILQESSSIIVKAGAQLRELWKDRESCQSFINEKPN
jgi:disease resistance protein RPS2